MNKVLIFGLAIFETEAPEVWADIEKGNTFEVEVANHYHFSSLGFNKPRMNASCTRFNAGKTALNRHSAIASFRVGLRYL